MFATVASSTSSDASSKPGKEEEKRLRIVVAVGGNALQRRGDRLTIENQMKAAAFMAPTMAELCKKHQLGRTKRRVDISCGLRFVANLAK